MRERPDSPGKGKKERKRFPGSRTGRLLRPRIKKHKEEEKGESDEKPSRKSRETGPEKKTWSKSGRDNKFSKEPKPFHRKDEKPGKDYKSDGERFFSREKKTEHKDPGKKKTGGFASFRDKKKSSDKSFYQRKTEGGGFKKPFKKSGEKAYRKPDERPERYEASADPDGTTRLNKYIANSGVCSRREADVLIQTGVITVNGKTITELGYRIKPTDMVAYGGQTIRRERMVYILLNKPKNFITTSEDPFDRKTVLSLVKDACRERVYPVGRLDRNTTGVLLITNDGELTKKLTHPRYEKKKIYQVSLDKALSREDMEQIESGVELEDGNIRVDAISYVTGSDKREVGVELHSGKNRIVRRIFEHLGYEVVKLDRVSFAGLTKKDLPRGRWRFLTEQEIAFLKMS